MVRRSSRRLVHFWRKFRNATHFILPESTSPTNTNKMSNGKYKLCNAGILKLLNTSDNNRPTSKKFQSLSSHFDFWYKISRFQAANAISKKPIINPRLIMYSRSLNIGLLFSLVFPIRCSIKRNPNEITVATKPVAKTRHSKSTKFKTSSRSTLNL